MTPPVENRPRETTTPTVTYPPAGTNTPTVTNPPPAPPAPAPGKPTFSDALAFTVDTLAPATPAVPTDIAVFNGYVNAAHDTVAQALTGSAELGSTVTIYDSGNSTPIGTATASATTGAWSFTLGTLADGSTHSYTVTATDAAGNVSARSAALAFTVDTTAPTAALAIKIGRPSSSERA